MKKYSRKEEGSMTEEKKEIRPKGKGVIDAERLKGAEVRLGHELEGYINDRLEVARFEKEVKEKKKEIDGILLEFMDDYEVDKIELLGATTSRVVNKGAMRWDAKYLQSVLSMEELEKARLPGTAYEYIKITEKGD